MPFLNSSINKSRGQLILETCKDVILQTRQKSGLLSIGVQTYLERPCSIIGRWVICEFAGFLHNPLDSWDLCESFRAEDVTRLTGIVLVQGGHCRGRGG